MSKLLLDEQPLLVLPILATKIGLNESIILQQIHYWIADKKKKKEHYFDNNYWVYNSIQAWQEQFPFWSTKTIQRTFTSLLDKGLLIKGNYNKDKYDRTLWYAIDYEKLEKIDNEEGENASGQNDQMGLGQCDQMPLGQNDQMEVDGMTQPIPETTTETTTEISTESLPSSKTELIDYFREKIGEPSKDDLWVIEYWLGKFDDFKTFSFAFVEAVTAAIAINNKNMDYIHKHLIAIFTYMNQNKGGD